MPNPRLGLITATPDLVSQGLVLALLDRLADHGLRPLSAIPHIFTAAETFMLYSGKSTHPRSERTQLHSGWLAPRLFMGGISLIILLRSDTEVTGGVQSYLCDIKGASRAGAATRNQLRGLSPSCDRNLSLVHCPDDEAGVVHELRLIFGKSFARWVDSLDPCDQNILSENWVTKLVPPSSSESGSAHPAASWTTALLRAVCLLVCDPACGVDTQLASSLIDALERLRVRVESAEGASASRILWTGLAALEEPATRLHATTVAALQSRSDVTGFARATARATLSRVIEASCAGECVDPVLSSLLVNALSALGSPPGYLEEQRLHVTTAYYES